MEPVRRKMLSVALIVLLLPVAAVAIGVHALIERTGRRPMGGLLACVAGVGLLAAIDGSIAGPAYVPFTVLRFVGAQVGQAVEETKKNWRELTGSTPVAEARPVPREWQAIVDYFRPWNVVLSSLGWGLLVGGATAVVRRQASFAGKGGVFRTWSGSGLLDRFGPFRGAAGGTEIDSFRNKLSWTERRALRKIGREDHPADGVLLGVEQGSGRPVAITDRELNQHVFLVGTTGSGKTTTIMNFVESALQRGLPLVLVDGKGDAEVAAALEALARTCGRTLKVFAMRGDSCRYDPLAQGGPTELRDKLLYLSEWSEPHYEALASRYLQFVLRVFERAGTRSDLPGLAQHLDPDRLAGLVRRIPDRREQADLLDVLDGFRTNEIRGLAARLAVLAESEIGHLFRREGDVIDLTRSIAAREVVLFSLDSLGFPEYSRLLGRLIVTDLKGAAARAYRQRSGMVYCIFDEFSVFISKAVVDLIGKARGAGFCALIATQSLGDIETAAGSAVVDQIIDNCNTFIIHQQNSPAGAEKLAGIVGTRRALELTRQVEETFLGRCWTGLGTVREVREYVVHPDEIKALRTGEAVVVRKAAGSVQRVWIRKVLL